MGKKYIAHSDMCGCTRCAAVADSEVPRQIFDCVEDLETLECGCSVWSSCDCARYDYDGDD